MFHPVFRLFASKPELVAQHVNAYAELASAEAGDMASRYKDVAVYGGLAAVMAALALALALVSVLIVAAIPIASMPYPWLLAVVPAVPAAAAFGAWTVMRGKQHPSRPFDLVREQWARDAAMWSEASRA